MEYKKEELFNSPKKIALVGEGIADSVKKISTNFPSRRIIPLLEMSAGDRSNPNPMMSLPKIGLTAPNPFKLNQ